MTEERIGREFHDRSDYFEGGTEHLQDLDSPFQKYRIKKVLQIYEPGPEERVLDLGLWVGHVLLGARLSLWTPHRGHFLEVLKARNILLRRDVSHVDYKSMERLKTMVTNEGFVVERAYYVESHLIGLRSIERAVQGWVPILRRRIAVLARKP